MLLQFEEYTPCHVLKGLKDASTAYRYCLEDRDVVWVENGGHLLHRRDVRQVPLVKLDGTRELLELVTLFSKIEFEVIETLHIRFHPLNLGISDKNHAIDSF